MKSTLFICSLLFMASFAFSQRVEYPPAPSSVYKPYEQNQPGSQQLKSTLWSNDVSGKIVRQTEPSLFSEGENQFELRTDNLNNGVYFVKFYSDFGSTTKRIVIQH